MAEDERNHPAGLSNVGSTTGEHSTQAAAGALSQFQSTIHNQSGEQRTVNERSEPRDHGNSSLCSRTSTVSQSTIGTVVQNDERQIINIEHAIFYSQSENAGAIDRQVTESTESRAELEGQLQAGDINWAPLSQTIRIDRNRPLCKHAEVYYAEQDMGGLTRELAVKILKKTDRSEAEAKFLARLEKHSNIVKIIDYGICDKQLIPRIFIAMELCLQNLDQYVANNLFNLSKASSFFQQTVSAICYIHDNSVAHGDLKPSNILLSWDRNSVKVSDFGVSKAIPDNQTKVTATHSGTDGFKAPESYEPGAQKCGYKADIFPLGINGYFIFTHGLHPFGPYSFDWLHNIVRNDNRDLSLVPIFPEYKSFKRPQLIKLLKRMLDHRPEERPTARDVQADVFFSESSQGVNVGYAGEGITSTTQDATYELIAEVLGNCQETLLPDVIKKLCSSLVDAEKKLKVGQCDEGVQAVRQSIPEPLDADDVNKIGKKLEDKYPVFSVLLHRVAAQIFNPKGISPEDAVDWISERVADIRCATEQIMDSELTGDSRSIAIIICPKFMVELLQYLRAVACVKSDVRTTCEVSCIISITRINIDAGKYPDVPPNENIINMCLEGLTYLENEFGVNVIKYKYYGYLLNNIGEAFTQLNQFEDAENYFKKALDVKTQATYRSREAKTNDIKMTNNNLRECRLRKNDHSN